MAVTVLLVSVVVGMVLLVLVLSACVLCRTRPLAPPAPSPDPDQLKLDAPSPPDVESGHDNGSLETSVVSLGASYRNERGQANQRRPAGPRQVFVYDRPSAQPTDVRRAEAYTVLSLRRPQEDQPEGDAGSRQGRRQHSAGPVQGAQSLGSLQNQWPLAASLQGRHPTASHQEAQPTGRVEGRLSVDVVQGQQPAASPQRAQLVGSVLRQPQSPSTTDRHSRGLAAEFPSDMIHSGQATRESSRPYFSRYFGTQSPQTYGQQLLVHGGRAQPFVAQASQNSRVQLLQSPDYMRLLTRAERKTQTLSELQVVGESLRIYRAQPSVTGVAPHLRGTEAQSSESGRSQPLLREREAATRGPVRSHGANGASDGAAEELPLYMNLSGASGTTSTYHAGQNPGGEGRSQSQPQPLTSIDTPPSHFEGRPRRQHNRPPAARQGSGRQLSREGMNDSQVVDLNLESLARTSVMAGVISTRLLSRPSDPSSRCCKGASLCRSCITFCRRGNQAKECFPFCNKKTPRSSQWCKAGGFGSCCAESSGSVVPADETPVYNENGHANAEVLDPSEHSGERPDGNSRGTDSEGMTNGEEVDGPLTNHGEDRPRLMLFVGKDRIGAVSDSSSARDRLDYTNSRNLRDESSEASTGARSYERENHGGDETANTLSLVGERRQRSSNVDTKSVPDTRDPSAILSSDVNMNYSVTDKVTTKDIPGLCENVGSISHVDARNPNTRQQCDTSAKDERAYTANCPGYVKYRNSTTEVSSTTSKPSAYTDKRSFTTAAVGVPSSNSRSARASPKISRSRPVVAGRTTTYRVRQEPSPKDQEPITTQPTSSVGASVTPGTQTSVLGTSGEGEPTTTATSQTSVLGTSGEGEPFTTATSQASGAVTSPRYRADLLRSGRSGTWTQRELSQAGWCDLAVDPTYVQPAARRKDKESSRRTRVAEIMPGYPLADFTVEPDEFNSLQRSGSKRQSGKTKMRVVDDMQVAWEEQQREVDRVQRAGKPLPGSPSLLRKMIPSSMTDNAGGKGRVGASERSRVAIEESPEGQVKQTDRRWSYQQSQESRDRNDTARGSSYQQSQESRDRNDTARGSSYQQSRESRDRNDTARGSSYQQSQESRDRNDTARGSSYQQSQESRDRNDTARGSSYQQSRESRDRNDTARGSSYQQGQESRDRNDTARGLSYQQGQESRDRNDTARGSSYQQGNNDRDKKNYNAGSSFFQRAAEGSSYKNAPGISSYQHTQGSQDPNYAIRGASYQRVQDYRARVDSTGSSSYQQARDSRNRVDSAGSSSSYQQARDSRNRVDSAGSSSHQHAQDYPDKDYNAIGSFFQNSEGTPDIEENDGVLSSQCAQRSAGGGCNAGASSLQRATVRATPPADNDVFPTESKMPASPPRPADDVESPGSGVNSDVEVYPSYPSNWSPTKISHRASVHLPADASPPLCSLTTVLSHADAEKSLASLRVDPSTSDSACRGSSAGSGPERDVRDSSAVKRKESSPPTELAEDSPGEGAEDEDEDKSSPSRRHLSGDKDENRTGRPALTP